VRAKEKSRLGGWTVTPNSIRAIAAAFMLFAAGGSAGAQERAFDFAAAGGENSSQRLPGATTRIPVRVRAHDKLADVEPCHDRFSCARIALKGTDGAGMARVFVSGLSLAVALLIANCVSAMRVLV
jgi:hypothetical protein